MSCFLQVTQPHAEGSELEASDEWDASALIMPNALRERYVLGSCLRAVAAALRGVATEGREKNGFVQLYMCILANC